ncbi:MAG: ACP S-malonyltransferase [Planctomycetota bacterium]|nr:ACP S-malonyltransferase [Planctomycetota bacterium]
MTSALLFPGQGAQDVGMGSGLTERSSQAKEYFQQASELLGYDLLELCLEGPIEELSRTEFSQPALFVHSYAALKQLESEQASLWDKISCVAGLSLGEYTAVAAAGGMSFEDGVLLVQARGQAMQAAADLVESGMSSVIGMDLQKLEEVCAQASEGNNDFVKPANLLCPGNIAVSGNVAALERLEKLAIEAGAMKIVRLQVAGAFHTSIMQPAVEKLEAALAEITFSDLRVPVYSNVDAKPHSAGEDFKSLLPKQVVSPVLWEASLQAVLETGIEECIEVGTGKVLAGTLKRVQRKFPCSNYGDS